MKISIKLNWETKKGRAVVIEISHNRKRKYHSTGFMDFVGNKN